MKAESPESELHTVRKPSPNNRIPRAVATRVWNPRAVDKLVDLVLIILVQARWTVGSSGHRPGKVPRTPRNSPAMERMQRQTLQNTIIPMFKQRIALSRLRKDRLKPYRVINQGRFPDAFLG